MRVILASSSPRRAYIMSMIGIDFITLPPKIRENFTFTNPILNARKLALKKAISVWKHNKDAITIGSDTIVYVENKTLGKPSNMEEAINMLRFLSGKWHSVVTAIAIVKKGKRLVKHDIARVKFRKLNNEEIISYVKSGQSLDKAGSYGIQDYGATFVEKIKGDFYTVMGMSPQMLLTLLEQL